MTNVITQGYLNEAINGIKINSSIKSNSKNYLHATSRRGIFVVMHYTANKKDTAKANANYFANGDRKASAHFFVDEKEIYQSVKLVDVAYHVGAKRYVHTACRNSNSVGIEMCTSGDYKVSDKTKENAAYLCARLCKMLGIKAEGVDTYVLRHYDVTGKNCPAQMVKNKKEWTDFKAKVKTILLTGDIRPVKKPSENTAAQSTKKEYKVKVNVYALNIRKGPGVEYDKGQVVRENEVYTIVETKDDWGKLKSGAGWISLKYTKKV